jgi:hypothetical protein
MYQKNSLDYYHIFVCIKPFTQKLLNLLTTIKQTTVQVSNILITPRKEGGEMLIPGNYKYRFCVLEYVGRKGNHNHLCVLEFTCCVISL